MSSEAAAPRRAMTGLAAFAVALAGAAHAAASEGTFEVASARGAVAVTTYRPAAWKASGPVWVVMHGVKRDAREYLAQWRDAAERHAALLVVPTFDKAAWPTSKEYPLGTEAFPVVDRAVDEAARRAGASSPRFVLYGHGAGAQFVQRYVFFMGASRLAAAVAAGAGWYLLPDDGFAYPYGLKGTDLPEAAVRAALAAPLVLMVGGDDVRTDGVLRNNAETLAQGVTRVDRARFALARARSVAQRLGTPFGWRLQEIPGVGHRPAAMQPAAERALADAIETTNSRRNP